MKPGRSTTAAVAASPSPDAAFSASTKDHTPLVRTLHGGWTTHTTEDYWQVVGGPGEHLHDFKHDTVDTLPLYFIRLFLVIVLARGVLVGGPTCPKSTPHARCMASSRS